MKAGDVALVPYPFEDSSTVKKRPVLVLAVIPPGRNFDVVVLQITSSQRRLDNLLDGDLTIDDVAVLPKLSVVRCRKLHTFRSQDFVRFMGTVDDAFLETAKATVVRLIDAA